ncbi:MAG: DUF6273 domain-containing protein [Lachnospiraceae bacterium]|nr:DUF6273 domain-containing protein [Lachnospiraceae bacterium]
MSKKSLLAILLVFLFMVNVFIPNKVEAATSTAPAVPRFKIKADNDNVITVTISKTKNADGFEIYWCGNGSAYDGYHPVLLDKDGTKQRKIGIGSFSEGRYRIYVRSYKNTSDGKVFSKNSGNRSITIKATDAKKEDNSKTISDYSQLKNGDIIIFGSYEQDNNLDNGKEPIEWIVLSNDGKELFVMSKYALDCQYYDEYRDAEEHTLGIWGVTWAECTLRKWLNDDFYNASFSDVEKKQIKTTTVNNKINPVYYDFWSIQGQENLGIDTEDKVFLLSLEDMVNTAYGFSSDYNQRDLARRCAATEYAMARGVMSSKEKFPEEWKQYELITADGEPTCEWYLRSPGIPGNTTGGMDINSVGGAEAAANISNAGMLCYLPSDMGDGGNFQKDGCGVRPALIIDLNQ